MRASLLAIPLLATSLLLSACHLDDPLDVGAGDVTKAGDGKFDSSVEAIFVDFEFAGELLASSSFNSRARIQDQLLYTIGHLNGERSVGRLDNLEVFDIQTQPAGGGMVRVTYQARLPVAWGKRHDVPSAYTLKLPRVITPAALQAFTEKYKNSCVDFSQASNVTSSSMWYYYRTNIFQCNLDPDDVVELDAVVSLSSITTTGKYPEYHKVYEDGVFRAVAIFGKNEEGVTSNSDAGIAAYNRFVRDLRAELTPRGLVTDPPVVPFSPGVDVPEVSFEADLGGGRRIEVTAILVDNVRTAGPAFDARYAALSTRADLIVYSGHAGLGANIRALAGKGTWVQGQYVIVFMNGCDTYAYIDDALFDAHAAINPDDPLGTKYTDIVTNAMPAFFHETPRATLAFIRGLMAWDEPLTYEQIFKAIDSRQVVLVSGEEDNVYFPGFTGEEEEEPWEGIDVTGTVAVNQEHRFETPVLPAGSYKFQLSGDADADLYVRLGTAPSLNLWDCRPFRANSNETCSVELSAPTPIHVMVRGWAPSSNYRLVAGPSN